MEDDSGASRQSKEVSYTVTDVPGSIEFGDILSQSEPENKSVPTKAAPGATDMATKSKVKTEDRKDMPAAANQATRSAEKPDSKLLPVEPVKSPEASDKDGSTRVGYQETQDVTLAWDSVPNATSYNIYWSDKPGVTRHNGTKISNVKNPYKMQGLKKGKKYYFVVTAVNASGESPESSEFSFTVGQ